MTEILLLAVTKMLTGICIGGVISGDRRWIRPVKEHGTILLGDVRLPDGTLMRPFDIIALNLGKPRPQPPHVEDVLCDFVRPRPQRVRHVPEEARAALLQAAVDPHPEEVLQRQTRSLTLFQPSDFTASFFHDTYSGKFEARLAWPGCGSDRGYPVTDLRWRALGRALLSDGGQLCLTWDEIQRWGDGAFARRSEPTMERTSDGAIRQDPFARPVAPSPKSPRPHPAPGTRHPAPPRPVAPSRESPVTPSVYLGLGLSRAHQGQLWPIVTGVHLLPDYSVTVDPRNL
jgi:hypothetical protein